MENLHFTDYVTDNAYSKLELPVFIINNEEQAKSFYNDNKQQLIDIFIKNIRMSLEEDLITVPVFNLFFLYGGGKYITVVIKRCNFDNILNNFLEYYQETEQYEKCQQILDLINNKIETF